MEIGLTKTIESIVIQTAANIISNLAWILLIIWAVKSIGKEIGKGVQKIPEWIDIYHKKQMERFKVREALNKKAL